MKKLTIYTLASFLGIASLSSCKKEITDKLQKTKNSIDNVINGAKAINDYEENMEESTERAKELASLTPISRDAFKNWLPDEVNGLKRTGYSYNKMPFANMELSFAGDDNKSVSLNIIDGAGESGASVYAMQTSFVSMGFVNEMEQESDSEITEIKEIDGVKCYQSYNKRDNFSTIMKTVNQRFFVNADARNMTVKETHDFLNKIDWKALEIKCFLSNKNFTCL